MYSCHATYYLLIAFANSFDKQLEQFGVDTNPMKESLKNRIFRVWLEDWEKEILKKDDCVAEAKLLEKYKDLVFYDPDHKVNFTVHGNNLEYRRGREGGWCVIGDSTDEKVEDEPFKIGDMLIEMIADTQQAEGVEIMHLDCEV